MIKCLVLLSFLVILKCQDEGLYYGTYSSNDFSFTLNDYGIVNLMIRNKKINDEIKVSYLGVFGNTLLFEIKFTDDKSDLNVAKLLIHFTQKGFVTASGFYVKMSVDEDANEVLKDHLDLKLDFKSE